MSSAIITCQTVYSVSPKSTARGLANVVTVELTEQQRSRAIVDLIGAMSETEAYALMRAEFPEWFTGVQS